MVIIIKTSKLLLLNFYIFHIKTEIASNLFLLKHTSLPLATHFIFHDPTSVIKTNKKRVH